MARVRVAVIMGGRSSEHDISVASARSVVDALDPERYDVRAVEIGQDGRWQLEPAAEQALHARLLNLLTRYNINDYAASVRVLAVKPR